MSRLPGSVSHRDFGSGDATTQLSNMTLDPNNITIGL